MCIVRQSDLSSEDLAVLSGNPVEDDEAILDLVIHEIPLEFGPVCLSQIVRKAELVPA